MAKSGKPIVVVSRCLVSKRCRYDGDIIADEFVKKIKPLVNFLAVCPEVQIGMPTPRDPIKILRCGKKSKVIQLATGKDFTRPLVEFSKKFLKDLKEVDGFILKSRSPSCGLKNVKIYSSFMDLTKFKYGKGVFASEVLKKFGHLAVSDDNSLMNERNQKRFFKKLFRCYES